MATKPPPYMLVIDMVDKDGRGWSEKYWVASDLTQSQADTLAASMLRGAAAVRTPEVTFLRVKIASAVPRAAFTYTAGNIGPTQGQIPGTSAPSNTALLIDLKSAPQYVSRVFLRGVPDANIDEESFVPTSAWASGFSTYGAAILGSGQICVRTSLTTPVLPQPITTAAPGNPKGIRLTLPVGTVLAVGTIIRIKGSPIPGYNGLKTVVQDLGEQSAGRVYQLGGANPISSLGPLVALTYTIPAYTAPLVSAIDIAGVGSRKTGRPFGAPRGRARTLFSLRP